MGIERKRIAVFQRALILGLEEGHFGDLKSIDISPAKLTKTIAAFANADGGELYIGIDEDKLTRKRTWRGFRDQEAANSHLQVFEGLFPLGTDFDYCFLDIEGSIGLVLQVQVKKTADIKKASDGTVYIRRGAQSLPVTTSASLKQLEYAKGLSSFESELVNADPIIITNSLPAIEFMLQVVPTAEPSAWLSKQQLLRQNKPSVAGVLLFAEEPQAVIPKRCGIKIYRYKTREQAGSRDTLAFDPLTVEGHAYVQIRDAVRRTTDVVQEIRKLGDESLENIEYPPEALHEVITNAVLHRDYSIADDIHIRVFDNRVEVQSPGCLPAHVTVKNILDERFARNGNLVRLINKFPEPPNKDVGEGLNTAFAAMVKLGLKQPIIEENNNSVIVTLKHEALASPEVIILEYLESHPTIRNKEARDQCHIGADYIVKDIFKRLAKRRLIEKVPGTDRSTTAYRKGARFSVWRKDTKSPG